MHESFSPWATAVATGANPQLNTFWKRRLAMLSSLKESSSRMTSRTVLILVCLALGALAVPTLKWATEGPLSGLTKRADAGSLVLLVDDQESDKSVGSAEPASAEPQRDDEYFPRPSQVEREILEALAKPVDVDFQDLALEDCITKLQEQVKIDLWLDRAKITEEGVSLDQPVTLKMKGRRLESILNLLLRPVQLNYVIEDDVLKITTDQAAQDTLFTRTYPIGDLLLELKPGSLMNRGGGGMGGGMMGGRGMGGGGVVQAAAPAQGGETGKPNEDGPNKAGDAVTNNAAAPYNNGGVIRGGGGAGGGAMGGIMGTAPGPKGKVLDYHSMMNLISTTVQPDSWEDLSGPGSMMPARVTSSLVIRQTRSVHAQVLQLFRDLRASKHVKRTPPEHASTDSDEGAEDEGPIVNKSTQRDGANAARTRRSMMAERGGFF